MLRFPRAGDRDDKSQALCGLVTRLTRTQCSRPKFPPMSVAGHSRRLDRITATSGLPRSADILRIGGHVSKVSGADIASRHQRMELVTGRLASVDVRISPVTILPTPDTTSTTSDISPIWPIGCKAPSCVCHVGEFIGDNCSRSDCVMRIPRFAYSIASDLVAPFSAPLINNASTDGTRASA
jgi:hypothetical protein